MVFIFTRRPLFTGGGACSFLWIRGEKEKSGGTSARIGQGRKMGTRAKATAYVNDIMWTLAGAKVLIR